MVDDLGRLQEEESQGELRSRNEGKRKGGRRTRLRYLETARKRCEKEFTVRKKEL